MLSMRMWFEFCNNWYLQEQNIWLGVSGYRHHWRKQYWGYTVNIMFFRWLVVINIVDNIVAYNGIMGGIVAKREAWLKKMKDRKSETRSQD